MQIVLHQIVCRFFQMQICYSNQILFYIHYFIKGDWESQWSRKDLDVLVDHDTKQRSVISHNKYIYIYNTAVFFFLQHYCVIV